MIQAAQRFFSSLAINRSTIKQPNRMDLQLPVNFGNDVCLHRKHAAMNR